MSRYLFQYKCKRGDHFESKHRETGWKQHPKNQRSKGNDTGYIGSKASVKRLRYYPKRHRKNRSRAAAYISRRTHSDPGNTKYLLWRNPRNLAAHFICILNITIPPNVVMFLHQGVFLSIVRFYRFDSHYSGLWIIGIRSERRRMPGLLRRQPWPRQDQLYRQMPWG